MVPELRFFSRELTSAEQSTLGLTLAGTYTGSFLRAAPSGGFPSGQEAGNGQLLPAMLPVNSGDGNTDEPSGVAAKASGGEAIYTTTPTNTSRPPVLPPYVSVWVYTPTA